MTETLHSNQSDEQKTAQKLSVFDMDHTLIDNDCDVSWKTFLVEKGLASRESLDQAAKFYYQYIAGQLALDEFLAFQLAEFIGHTPAEMQKLAHEHCQDMVRPRIYQDAITEVKALHDAGRATAICTSTNNVIAAPVAELFGIGNLIATKLEVVDGVFTGRIEGAYCSGNGKVGAVKKFCRKHNTALAAVTYYGDSQADIPLLTAVGEPVAVNPGPVLHELAVARGWQTRRFT